MPLHILNEELWFPPVEDALDDGLLAIGGDLSTERLLLAYKNGIFPWFDEEIPLWWCPDPRFVLYPDELKVSKSMKQTIKQGRFEFRKNTAFAQVISSCRQASRKDQDGTWITAEVQKAYTKLHELGYAHCAEAWMDGALVGGLYGVQLGKIFFGESMFSHESNASKYAFIRYVEDLNEQGIQLIDCQVYTRHLESLGARMIDRSHFSRLLEKNI